MNLHDFARLSGIRGHDAPPAGMVDPERYDELAGYDGPPAADDQDAARARLRAREAEYLRTRDAASADRSAA